MSGIPIDYFAGIIDGEGWIGIALHKRMNRGCRYGVEYVPHVGACMGKGGYIVEEIKNRWGGNLNLRKRDELKWNNITNWTIRGPRCRTFLEEIAPHLILKKRQAELVLEFFRLQGERGKDALYPDVKFRQMEIYNELRKLNSRGKIKPELTDPEVLSNGRIYYRFSKAELERLYLEKKLSAREIAEQYGAKTSMVSHALNRFSIPIRSRSEFARMGSERSSKVKLFASKEDLEEAYVIEGKSTREVGRQFGVSHVQVIKALRKYGIERRSRGVALRDFWAKRGKTLVG